MAVLCVQTEPSYRPLITDILHSLIPLVPNELGGSLRVTEPTKPVCPGPSNWLQICCSWLLHIVTFYNYIMAIIWITGYLSSCSWSFFFFFFFFRELFLLRFLCNIVILQIFFFWVNNSKIWCNFSMTIWEHFHF